MVTNEYTKGALTAALAMAAVCGLAVRSRYECGHFAVERVVLPTPKVKEPHTLVFLTDLHDARFGPGNRLLVQAVQDEAPDAILIGGDLPVAKRGRVDLRPTAAVVTALSAVAPVFYAYGNHEARLGWHPDEFGGAALRLARLLRRAGVTVLRNQTALVGEDLAVSGLDLTEDYYGVSRPRPLTAAGLTARLGRCEGPRYHILLAHTPVFAASYLDWGADLTLCGHYHGGVVRLPGCGGLVTPQKPLMPQPAEGTIARGAQRVVIGRGLGSHTVNLRLNNRPQLLVVRLEPQGDFVEKG